MEKYTYKMIAEQLGISRTSVEKRVKRLKLNPLKEKGSVFFNKKEYDLIVNYKTKNKYYYRVSILENGLWIIKHIGLSYCEAQKLEDYYINNNIYATKYKY